MKALLLLLLIIASIIQSSDSILVSFELFNFLYCFFVERHLGSQYNVFNSEINQASDYSTTYPQQYDFNKSATARILHNTTIDYFNVVFQAVSVEDIIHFKEPNVSFPFKFRAMPAGSQSPNNFGQFGLAFRFEDEDYSVVHLLKKNGVIENISYSFTNVDDHRALHIGGIPEPIVTQMQRGSCKVDPHFTTWGCQLNKVIVSASNGFDYIYSTPTYASFNIQNSFVYAPIEYYTYLKDTVFASYLKSGECQEKIYTFSQALYCNDSDEIMRQLPNITFVFSNTAVTIPIYFKKDKMDKNAVAIKKIIKPTDYWVFSSNFLLEFQTLFDYENQSITFYSATGVNKSEKPVYLQPEKINDKIRKGLLVLVSTITLIGLILFIYLSKPFTKNL